MVANMGTTKMYSQILMAVKVIAFHIIPIL